MDSRFDDPELITNFFHAKDIYFKQYVTPLHYYLDVRAYLDATFLNKCVGRKGSIEFSVSSPDLTLVNFCLWGQLEGPSNKSAIFGTYAMTVPSEMSRNIV